MKVFDISEIGQDEFREAAKTFEIKDITAGKSMEILRLRRINYLLERKIKKMETVSGALKNLFKCIKVKVGGRRKT